MCHKCEERQSQLHLEYLKHRGIGAIEPMLDNPVLYSLLIQQATLNSKTFLAKVENGGSGVTGEDVSYFSVVMEKKALDFARSHLATEALKKDIQIAKTIEHLVDALKLVQSKADLVGSEAIVLDVQDALHKYDNTLFKFGQSSKELQEILDSAK